MHHLSNLILCPQLESALMQMGEVTSHNISKATRLSYSQVGLQVLAIQFICFQFGLNKLYLIILILGILADQRVCSFPFSSNHAGYQEASHSG